MDHYSPKLREMLKKTASTWLRKRRDEEELCFTPSALKIRITGDEQTWDYSELLQHQEEQEPQIDLVQQCLRDLEGIETPTIIFPHYIDKPEDLKIEFLLEYIEKDTFRDQSNIERLEAYYYLGEVLTSQGWTQEDNKLLLRTANARRTLYIRKNAKRTFELFSARGIAHLYTTSFIRPTYLVQITKADFYGRLLPAVREMRLLELAL
jgi:hypothetical protein